MNLINCFVVEQIESSNWDKQSVSYFKKESWNIYKFRKKMFILCGIEFFFSARATIKSNSHSIYILYLSLTNIYFLFLADIFFFNFKQTLFHFVQIDIQKYYSYKFLFSFIMNAILFFFFYEVFDKEIVYSRLRCNGASKVVDGSRWRRAQKRTSHPEVRLA